jgi:hypothetical protein
MYDPSIQVYSPSSAGVEKLPVDGPKYIADLYGMKF